MSIVNALRNANQAIDRRLQRLRDEYDRVADANDDNDMEMLEHQIRDLLGQRCNIDDEARECLICILKEFKDANFFFNLLSTLCFVAKWC